MSFTRAARRALRQLPTSCPRGCSRGDELPRAPQFVDGGSVVLSNRTLLKENSALEGGAIYLLAPGTASYTLPAPLARYLYIARGDTQFLVPGGIGVDYPFECGGGVWGNSYALDEQSGPWCSGQCPPGHECVSGTTTPTTCPEGHVCPLGTTVGPACPAGTWSNQSGLSSNAECSVCPAGHTCSGGRAIACPQNTWNDFLGSSSLADCEP